MKSVISKAIITAALALLSNQSIAGCASQAILGAPDIPAIEDTQRQDMPALTTALKNYVERAERQLEICRGRSSSFEFNVAVIILETKVEKFNRMVRFYNRNANQLAMN